MPNGDGIEDVAAELRLPVLQYVEQAGAANAALFAVAMLATGDDALRGRLDAFRARQTEAARAMTQELR